MVLEQFMSNLPVIRNVGRNRNNIDMPLDVILQILSGLPVKSLCRFKCVCKSWCVAIQDQNFIEMHMGHNSRSDIIKLHKEKKSDNNGHNNSLWVETDELRLEENLMTKQYLLSNSVTKETIVIPHPHRLVKFMKLSYIQNDYKLVIFYSKKGTEEVGGCKVLTVGTDLEWRSLDIPSLQSFPDRTERTTCMLVLEVFFLFRFITRETRLSEIIYVEMGSEHFGSIEIPHGILTEGTNIGFAIWKQDKVAVTDLVNHKLHIWILEDYKKQKWAESKIVVSLSFLRENLLLGTTCSIYTVTAGGWLCYFHKEHYVAFHIETKKLQVTCAPPGVVFSGINRVIGPCGYQKSILYGRWSLS